MKIGFATNDWSRSMINDDGTPALGGSGYIRFGQYVQPIKNIGHKVEIGILAFNNRTNRFGIHNFKGYDHFDCDVIIIQRYMHKDALRDMQKARDRGQIIINDVDDWYWGLSTYNAAKTMTDPSVNPNENIDHYRKIISCSSGITVSTPFLLNKIKQWNSNIAMQENYVDISKFTKRQHTRTARPVVGWMGSTAHRSGDLHILRGHADQILKFASWHHTGHVDSLHFPKFWDEVRIPAGSVTRTNFLKPQNLNDGIVFDMGIVPLVDIPFNNAKSWIKGIEYAAAGVPFVASPSDEYLRLSTEHGIGTLAKRPRDFVRHLKSLTDYDYRVEVANKNYERVHNLDISIGAKSFVNNIEKLINEAK